MNHDQWILMYLHVHTCTCSCTFTCTVYMYMCIIAYSLLMVLLNTQDMLEKTGVVKKSKSTSKHYGKNRPKVAANFTLKNTRSLPDVASPTNSDVIQSNTQQSIPKHNDESNDNIDKQIPIIESESHSDDMSIDKAKITEVSSSVESNAIDDFFKVIITCTLYMYM